MTYYGDLDTGAILDFKFTTVNGLGAPTTLAGTPVVSVYKDNGTTQSVAGVTLTVDFDAVTGCNHVRIDTSADAGFYAAGSDFQVEITTGTVDGVSAVGYVVGAFSILNRSALRPTTPGETLNVTSGEVDVASLAAAVLAALADAVHDEVVEGSVTLRQSLRLANAANGGKVAGMATATVTIRDPADTKTRVTSTVDAVGNRSAVTHDLT